MPTSIPATQHPETRGRGRPKTGGGFVTADTLDAAIAAWNAFDGATTEYADLHKFGAFVELRQAMSRVERERDKTA